MGESEKRQPSLRFWIGTHGGTPPIETVGNSPDDRTRVLSSLDDYTKLTEERTSRRSITGQCR